MVADSKETSNLEIHQATCATGNGRGFDRLIIFAMILGLILLFWSLAGLLEISYADDALNVSQMIQPERWIAESFFERLKDEDYDDEYEDYNEEEEYEDEHEATTRKPKKMKKKGQNKDDSGVLPTCRFSLWTKIRGHKLIQSTNKEETSIQPVTTTQSLCATEEDHCTTPCKTTPSQQTTKQSTTTTTAHHPSSQQASTQTSQSSDIEILLEPATRNTSCTTCPQSGERPSFKFPVAPPAPPQPFYYYPPYWYPPVYQHYFGNYPQLYYPHQHYPSFPPPLPPPPPPLPPPFLIRNYDGRNKWISS